MTKSHTRRDVESLSAYLDGQLSPRQTRQLESRLKREPDLLRALEDLNQTRRVLRSASQVRRTRNFTLTPEMAGKRVTSPRGYTVMRLVAVTASFLFAFVFAGDLLFGSRALSGMDSMPASEPAVEMYAIQEVADEVVEEAEAPMALGAVEQDAAPGTAQERAFEADVPAEETPTESVGEDAAASKAAAEDTSEGGAAAGGVNALEATGTPTLMGTPLPPDAAQPPPEAPPGTTGGTSPPLVEATGEISPADEDLPWTDENGNIEEGLEKTVDTPEGRVQPRTKIPLIRLIEGSLIVIALLSGGFAIFLRRRMK